MTDTTTTTAAAEAAATPYFTVPLDKLFVSEDNVRRTGADTALDELAASIAAHGLLNPLTVAPAAKGKYAVIAGQRRLLALQKLAQDKRIGKTFLVPCFQPDGSADRAELSLAENVARVAMHPADQFEAWRGLIDKGAAIPEIAARFGVAESTVRKRLALGRVAPSLLAAYRDGDMALEALQAFTVTDDHALQESVWESLSGWQREDARAIRRALTETDVPADDKRVRFVGLDEYEAAGGPVRRDLFDDKGGGYVQDAALLDRMARSKLDALAETLKAEGWAWAESRIDFAWEDREQFEETEPVEADVPESLQAEAEALRDEHQALTDADHDGDDDTDEGARLRAIEARLDEIEALALVWPDEVKARAGAVIYLSHGGKPEIERGLVRIEDLGSDEDGEDDAGSGDSGDDTGEAAKGPARPVLPAKLIEDLTAQKTAALRIEAARNPDVALALTVHALATVVFYRTGACALQAFVRARSLKPSIAAHESCPALLALNDERDRIGDLIPGDHAALWDWCLAAERPVLLDVLAVAVAHGIDAVQTKAEPNAGSRRHAEALATALKLDMTQWYRPTAKGYFSRITKPMILADLEAARGAPGAPAWAKLPKTDLADLAEREIGGSGWLPVPLH